VTSTIGDNSFDQRELARLRVANQARRIWSQQWDASLEELRELIEMLGLHPDFDPPGDVPFRARVAISDCGPMADAVKPRVVGGKL
jgi:hypothetical protein